MIWPPLRLTLIWGVLLLGVAVTLVSAYVPLGSWNLPLNLVISASQALLILFLFMDLAEGPSLIRIFAGGGLFYLLILIGMMLIDYLTRTGFPPDTLPFR